MPHNLHITTSSAISCIAVGGMAVYSHSGGEYFFRNIRLPKRLNTIAPATGVSLRVNVMTLEDTRGRRFCVLSIIKT